MQPRFKEVQLPPARIQQKGYSFVPLNDSGWYVWQENQHALSIGKRGEGQHVDETFIVQGSLMRLSAYKDPQELVRIVKDGQAKDVDPKRFRMITHEVSYRKEKNADCVKAYSLAEDTAAVKRSERQDSMMLEILMLTCAHPQDKSLGLNLAYSHRYYPGHMDPKFIEKGSSVLSSVEFDDF
jgi:hypothetical protein